MLTGFQSMPLSVSQLSLPAVLKCGQSFRWREIPLKLNSNGPSSSNGTTISEQEFRLALKDRIVCLRQTSDTLFYRAIFPKSQTSRPVSEQAPDTLSWLRNYFQLDVDLVGLYDDWSARDSVFEKLRARFEGIRILRQDPWENLIS